MLTPDLWRLPRSWMGPLHQRASHNCTCDGQSLLLGGNLSPRTTRLVGLLWSAHYIMATGNLAGPTGRLGSWTDVRLIRIDPLALIDLGAITGIGILGFGDELTGKMTNMDQVGWESREDALDRRHR